MGSMKYPIAQRFKSIQGEGQFTGTPMAFIRSIGCSVGKGVCTKCDTDFDRVYPERGGGLYTLSDLLLWVGDYDHVCITGGEPLDRDWTEFVRYYPGQVHIETSGTVMDDIPLSHWLTVSPKPGYLDEMIQRANEVKVIVGGLGAGEGWPTVEKALEWAAQGKPVYLQAANFGNAIDPRAAQNVFDLVVAHPTLRLSAQLHKYLLVE
jgi:7-carboxy-7-deazaguanine synthase